MEAGTAEAGTAEAGAAEAGAAEAPPPTSFLPSLPWVGFQQEFHIGGGASIYDPASIKPFESFAIVDIFSREKRRNHQVVC